MLIVIGRGCKHPHSHYPTRTDTYSVTHRHKHTHTHTHTHTLTPLSVYFKTLQVRELLMLIKLQILTQIEADNKLG